MMLALMNGHDVMKGVKRTDGTDRLSLFDLIKSGHTTMMNGNLMADRIVLSVNGHQILSVRLSTSRRPLANPAS